MLVSALALTGQDSRSVSASAGPAETDGPRTRGLRRFSVGELRGGPSTSPSRDTRSRICRLPAVSGPACHQGSLSASGCGKRQHTHCACLINGRSANLVVCLSMQIQQLTLSSELALVANTGCLGSSAAGPGPVRASTAAHGARVAPYVREQKPRERARTVTRGLLVRGRRSLRGRLAGDQQQRVVARRLRPCR